MICAVTRGVGSQIILMVMFNFVKISNKTSSKYEDSR